MPRSEFQPSKNSRKALIWFVSASLLFWGFTSDLWGVADREWFINFQRDDESLVIGRLVKSRQDGTFSAGGLTGFGSPYATPVKWDDQPFEYQYRAYINGLKLGPYVPYMSQIGGQALLLRVLDVSIPVSPQWKLKFFHVFTSLLSALTLTMIVLWFFEEFGLCVATVVLASMVLSQWLVVFGRNLWWSIWAFYLPMVVLMFFLRHNRAPSKRHLAKFGTLVFIVVFVKCLFNGYEYITTTLIMMIVPFFYYSIRDHSNVGRFLKGTLMAMCSSGLAISLTFAILCFQIASVPAKGNIMDGVVHIVDTFKKRSHADPRSYAEESAYRNSLASNTTPVVGEYLKGTYFDLNNYISSSRLFVSRYLLKVRYAFLIVLFGLVSAFEWSGRNRDVNENERRSRIALTLTTWFSILAPLSWFVVFKAHSYIHTHMNFIVWQMPFIFFGFALCGLSTKRILLGVMQAASRSHVLTQ